MQIYLYAKELFKVSKGRVKKNCIFYDIWQISLLTYLPHPNWDKIIYDNLISIYWNLDKYQKIFGFKIHYLHQDFPKWVVNLDKISNLNYVTILECHRLKRGYLWPTWLIVRCTKQSKNTWQNCDHCNDNNFISLYVSLTFFLSALTININLYEPSIRAGENKRQGTRKVDVSSYHKISAYQSSALGPWWQIMK